MKVDRVEAQIRRKIYVRILLLLFGSLIPGLMLLIAFGAVGLVFSLLFYLIALVLATNLLKEYWRSPTSSNKYKNRMMLFNIDAFAATSVMLGIVMRVAATKYGHIYEQVGFALISIAIVLWAGSLIAAVADFHSTGDRIVLIIAFTFTWFSMLSTFSLLLQLPSFWRLSA